MSLGFCFIFGALFLNWVCVRVGKGTRRKRAAVAIQGQPPPGLGHSSQPSSEASGVLFAPTPHFIPGWDSRTERIGSGILIQVRRLTASGIEVSHSPTLLPFRFSSMWTTSCFLPLPPLPY